MFNNWYFKINFIQIHFIQITKHTIILSISLNDLSVTILIGLVKNLCWQFLISLAETDPHEGKRKVEALWPIFKIHHQRSRYIFDLFYKRKAISRGNYLIQCFINLKLPIWFNLNKYYAFLFRIVRLLLKRTYRRFQSHRKMEKARIRELVLPQVHSNKRHKFWYKLHLPGAQS